MTIDEIKKARDAQPFMPFRLRTGGGREYRVPHPEFLSILRPARMVWVYDPDSEGAGDILDAMLVESIHFESEKKRPRNGKSRKRKS